MSRSVCYIGFFPDYEKIFFENSSSNLFNVRCYNPIEETNCLLGFEYLPRFIRNWVHKQKIKNYITKNPDTYYIFNEHRLLLKAITELLVSQSHLNFKGSLLLRNPIADNYKIKPYLETLKSRAIAIWTFDYGDHQKFGYALYRQFASLLPEFLQKEVTVGFSFVGRDKGRKQLLDELKQKLRAIDYQVDFDIRSVDDKNLSYLEYLEKSLHADCMVEILQHGQKGMTLRAVEALLYQKKLITNNSEILQADFFHPDNILLLGELNILSEDIIKLFMSKPYHAVSQAIVQKYTTEFLLNTVVGSDHSC